MMKKQFYLSHGGSFVNYITLYHDGVEISTEKVWDDELWDRIEHLHSQGYTRGFGKAAVEKARKEYEHLRDNLIEGI